jgi:putative hemolysin
MLRDSIVENLAGCLRRLTIFDSSQGLVSKLLPLHELRDLYKRVQRTSAGSWFDGLLEEMQVSFSVAEVDLKRIPRTGAVLVVSNHPFGILDGAVLGALFSRVRDDAKIMTNFLLNGVEELQDHCLFVDPFNRGGSLERNRRALKKALLWLREGHMLVVFPAGEVSHLRLTVGGVADPEWNPMIARLARSAGASALPVFFQGRNSIAFHALGLIHPGLRTAWLANEFLKQRGKTLNVRIGTAVADSTIAGMPNDEEAIEYLRRRSYLLGRRSSRTHRQIGTSPSQRKGRAPLAPEIDKELLIAEIHSLSLKHRVEDTREFSVYVARGSEIPNLLQELGRLREIAFREVGEGSGYSRDLDRFDDYYLHVLLWDKQNRRPAGAYRMTSCPEILPTRGLRGLYTSTLFHYQPEFFERLGPAVELGRSFVSPEYQRKFASLLLLWKGIGAYISRHPETPVLFGAVSISAHYSSTSRELIVKYFESRRCEEIARFVRPRRPFRPLPFQPWDCAGTCRALRDLADLTDSVSDLESDAKGIPILFRQYANLGGKFVAFNMDRNFADVLDGLVLLDLRRTDPSALERYMGKEGFQRFCRYHGPTCDRQEVDGTAEIAGRQQSDAGNCQAQQPGHAHRRCTES